jgi:hypothetical protein
MKLFLINYLEEKPDCKKIFIYIYYNNQQKIMYNVITETFSWFAVDVCSNMI